MQFGVMTPCDLEHKILTQNQFNFVSLYLYKNYNCLIFIHTRQITCPFILHTSYICLIRAHAPYYLSETSTCAILPVRCNTYDLLLVYYVIHTPNYPHTLTFFVKIQKCPKYYFSVLSSHIVVVYKKSGSNTIDLDAVF